MKVAIDTRYDTLEEALAVVALAFEASAKGATRKPKRADKKTTSGRKPGRKRAAPAEPKAPDMATDGVSPSETNGSRRRTATKTTAARKATVAKSATTNAPPKKSTTRKAVATAPAPSGTAAKPGTATTAAASKAPATRTVSKSASANGSVKPKRVAAKKANPAQTQSPTPANVAPPGQSDKIRAWARSQGMQVADAGRMSAAVIAAYQAHHN
jgi:starch synthase